MEELGKSEFSDQSFAPGVRRLAGHSRKHVRLGAR
jgi:hypothetical protein